MPGATGGAASRDDAVDLIARFGGDAYYVARDRVRAGRGRRTVDANRPDGHSTKVKLRIADLTGKEVGLDRATRQPSRLT